MSREPWRAADGAELLPLARLPLRPHTSCGGKGRRVPRLCDPHMTHTARMVPRLRRRQAMTAGVEMWLGRPDLDAEVLLLRVVWGGAHIARLAPKYGPDGEDGPDGEHGPDGPDDGRRTGGGRSASARCAGGGRAQRAAGGRACHNDVSIGWKGDRLTFEIGFHLEDNKQLRGDASGIWLR